MVNLEKYDFYKHYDFNEKNQIVFSFTGKISDPILQSIVTILEDKLNDHKIEKSYARRIISIVIELTQNIQRYSLRKTIHHDQEYGHGMLVVRKIKAGFRIYAGNLLTPENGRELIKYCSQYIKLSQKSLKEKYREKLGIKSERAGVGLMYILRKSNSMLEIKTHRVDDNTIFVAFSVLVH